MCVRCDNVGVFKAVMWYLSCIHSLCLCCIVYLASSLVPRPFEGKAWGLLRAHARKISFIFRIICRKISNNDVIVHGESARKEYADTFVYTVQ